MASQALGFAEILGGGVLLTMGITGYGVRDVLAGRAGSIKPLGGGSAQLISTGAGEGGSQFSSLRSGAAGERTRGERIALLHRVLKMMPGINITEGPGFGGATPGVHVSDSLHYEGLAYDITGPAGLLRRLFSLLQRLFPGEINELFYDPIGYYIDQGNKVDGAIGGHGDHLHIGFFPAR